MSTLGKNQRLSTLRRLMRPAVAVLTSMALAAGLLVSGPVGSAQAENITDIWTGFDDPYSVAVSPDGATAYVISNGTVSVRNTSTGTQTASWTGFNTPYGVALSPNGATAYVANLGNNTVSVRNTSTGTQTASWTGFNTPTGVAVSPDGATAYVANLGNNTVSVRNTSTGTQTASWTVFNAPRGVALSPDGATAYVANGGSSSVSVRNTSTGTQTASWTAGFNTPYGVAVNPDGATAYVTDFHNSSVSVRNTSTGTQTASWTGFDAPMGVAVSPNGATAYVTSADNTVSVVSLSVPVPSAPEKPTAEATGSGVIRVTVTPGDGEPAESFVVQAYYNGNPVTDRTCAVSANDDNPVSCQITGLNRNISYTLRAVAKNSGGDSAESVPSDLVLANVIPQVPSVDSVQGLNDRVRVVVNFTTNADTYNVKLYDLDNNEVAQCSLNSGDFLACNNLGVGTLDPAKIYRARVTATNSAGTTAPSAWSSPVVPTSGVLGEPKQPMVDVTADGEVTVGVVPADSPGPVAQYVVQAYLNGEAVSGKTCSVLSSAGELSCSIPDLDQDKIYEFKVVAKNGDSSPTGSTSVDSLSVKPVTGDPGAPGKPQVASGAQDGQVVVTVDPGEDAGAVAAYEIEALLNGEPVNPPAKCTVRADANPLRCTVSDLEVDKAYTFVVVAKNGEKTSGTSTPSSPVVPSGGGKPAKPNPPLVTPGDEPGWVDVEVDLGDPVPPFTEIVVTPNGAPGTACVIHPEDPQPYKCTVTDLDPGKPYTFDVVVKNGDESSDPSDASSPVIADDGPLGRPGKPSVTPGNEPGKVDVTIDPGEDPHGPVAEYAVFIKGQEEPVCSVPATANPLVCHVEGLDPDTVYEFEVKAKNGANNLSEPSEDSDPVIPDNGPLGKPGVPSVTPGDGEVTVTVNPGGSPGPVTQWRVRVKGDPDKFCLVPVGSESMSCLIDGLESDGVYQFEVLAFNGEEASELSDESVPAIPSAAKPGQPGQPTVVIDEPGKVTVTVNPSENPDPVTQYRVKIKGNEDPTKVCLITRDENGNWPAQLRCEFDDLDQNVVYEFEVTATNGTNESDSSPSSMPVKPVTGVLGTPGKPQVEPGSEPGTVDVTVTPADTPGPVAVYEVEAFHNGQPLDPRATCVVLADAQELKCTIPGLEDDETYTFKVTAQNGGEAPSDSSDESVPVIPDAGELGQPGTPVAGPGPGDGEVTVGFLPADPAGPVTEYVIYVKGDPDKKCIVTRDEDGNWPEVPFQCSIGDLTSGEVYEFEVIAKNGDKASDPSSPSVPVNPDQSDLGMPGKPQVEPGPGENEVTVTVDQGDAPGPVTQYTVQVKGDPDKKCTITLPAGVDGLTCKVTGLDPDQVYEFEVIAHNGGLSEGPSDNSEPVIPDVGELGVPGAPSVEITDDGAVEVTVNPAEPTGPVSHYVVEALINGEPLTPPQTCVIPAGGDLSCPFEGLDPGKVYGFEVTAHNGDTSSDPSEGSKPVRPATGELGIPQPPTVTVKADSEVTVTVNESDEPGPVAQYVVTANPGGQTCTVKPNAQGEWPDPKSCDITGLDPATTYEFTTVAVNGDETSGESGNSNPVIPDSDALEVPGQPKVIPNGEGSVSVEVTPAEPAGPVVDYVVRVKGDPDKVCTVPASASPKTCTIDGLDANTVYEFEVLARNGDTLVGPSDQSTPVKPSLTEMGVPGKPTAVPGDTDGEVAVTVAPAQEPGPVAQYVVQAYLDGAPVGAPCVVLATSENLSCLVTGLDSDEIYEFKVSAKNGENTSAESESSVEVIPSTDPLGTPLTPTLTIPSPGVVEVTVRPDTSGEPGPVTRYVTRVKGQPDKFCGPDLFSGDFTCQITGLDPSQSYEFETVSFNGDKASDPSASTTPVKPDNGVLGQPGKPAADVGANGDVVVTVTPATVPGPVSEYVVTLKGSDPVKQCTILANRTPLSCSFTGLDPNGTYEFEVVARNGDQESDKSVDSDPVVLAAPAAPPAPRVAIAAHGSVSVTFGRATTGGTPATFTAIAAPGGRTCTVSAHANPAKCVVKGLNPNVRYTFTARATNGLGSQTSAKSGMIVPSLLKKPAKVVKVKVKPKKKKLAKAKRITVTWKAPKRTAMTPVTGYQVRVTVKGSKKRFVKKKSAKQLRQVLKKKSLVRMLPKKKRKKGKRVVATVWIYTSNSKGLSAPVKKRIRIRI